MSFILSALTGLGRTFFLAAVAVLAPPSSFLVQESDGTSKFLLEDGSGSIGLEA